MMYLVAKRYGGQKPDNPIGAYNTVSEELIFEGGLEVSSPTATAVGGEDRDMEARTARMVGYWNDPQTAVLWKVGKVLMGSAGNGRTLADVVGQGGTVKLTHLVVN